MEMKKQLPKALAVVGLGYVGLPLAVSASKKGNREIYYRYWEIFDTMPTVSFDEIKAQSKKIREIVGEEFGISESGVQSINDKVIKSEPTEYEMRIFDAFEKRAKELEAQGSDEDKARGIIASQFGITPTKVRAIWAHVISWQLE